MLTQETLKSLLKYDPLTGDFTWRVTRPGKAVEGSVAGYKKKGGYTAIKIGGRTYKAHRLVFLYMTGEWPLGMVGHSDGDTWDNRWDSLSDFTGGENTRDCKLRKDNTSGVVGVVKSKRLYVDGTFKWNATINTPSGRVQLYTGPNFEDAVKARLEAEIKYGYNSNHGKRS